ncbi:hypothetical protein SVIO_063970 [Streptomyces violaceusniger]|uniref:Uncharacterized protein n=1 Tax=Streptomyces violaceusniger TaxID=68280 RepID=A0A4D4L5V5_STRVO|nr:hypothetical protein SVIO_063970 [Streptomyces violaceusniger]
MRDGGPHQGGGGAGAVGRRGQLTGQRRVGGVVEQPAGLVQQLTDRDGPAVVAVAAHQPREVFLHRVAEAEPPLGGKTQRHRRDDGLGEAARPEAVVPVDPASGADVRDPRGEVPRAAALPADEHRGPRRVALGRQPPYGGAQDTVTAALGARARARARPRVRVPARFRGRRVPARLRGRRAAAGQDEREGGGERHGGRHTAPPVPSYGGDGHDTDLRFLRTPRWSQVPRWPPRRAPDPRRFRVRG